MAGVIPHQADWHRSTPRDVIQMTVTLHAAQCIHCLTIHVCGSQALEPNLWATATLMASSDSLSPTAVIGGACSQSPECGEATAKSLALSTSDGALERIRFF